MSRWQVYRWPGVIAVLTTAGLLLGLLSDGWVDALAVASLLLPVVCIARVLLRRPG